LGALASQTCRDFEVIIIDNASTDDAPAGLIEKYPALDLRVERLESNLGFAAASNAGARLARGAWLVLLNPDAYPEPDWLEQLIKAAHSSSDSFFASRQIQADRPRLLDGEGDVYHVSGLAQRRNFNFPVFRGGQPHEVFSACAAAAMYPRQAFLDAGGFDEDYFAYHEDVDLGFRLRLRGLKCVFVPAAVVHHVGTGSTGPRSAFSTYYGHRNLVWTFVKDMPPPWSWVYLPLHLGMNMISILYFILIGQGGAILRAKFDALRGLRSALKKRGLIQAQRRVPPAEILRAMSRNPLAPLGGWIARHYPPTD
jgi:GT2 family glycosyltransferase